MHNSYPKSSRISSGTDIRRALKTGKSSKDHLFSVHALVNKLSRARLGIAVSRRVSGRAVDRNRIKRLVRESFRHEQTKLCGLDIVVVAQPPSRLAEPIALRESLQTHWTTLKKKCVVSS